MKLSLSWIKQYTDVDIPVDEVVKKIGAQLGEVEAVENLGLKYDKAVIAKIVSCEKHPNADRLHVCTVDDGGNTPDVKRDEQGHVQVVCGAPNVREGLFVVWLPPGATVPSSVGTADPFVLQARELRGVVSNGMLASPKELGIGDSHEGILEVDPDEWSPNQQDIAPGASFAKVFGLDEAIIDIENKMFTHRPDLFGELGLAREVAGITGKRFASPDWYTNDAAIPDGDGLALNVVNETPELVPRFMALTVKNVTVKPSPLWLQCALASVGQKPINNIVDVTNYIMLLTAQPTHAYDYDKLRGGTLMARQAKPGETVTLLNHKTYELDLNDIVIADGEGAVGLGGIMGGGNSEVSQDTKNIVLECATFDMYAVRRSSMRHGIFTDALTRFNKGQSPLQNPYVLHLLLQSVQDVAGGEAAGPVADKTELSDRKWVHPPVPVTVAFINDRLGLALAASEMQALLENVEFEVVVDGVALTVTAPFWRTDIETREDVVEEVGRLYGYDKLPLILPMRSLRPTHKDRLLNFKSTIRDTLARYGANELLTYSFVHGNLLAKVGQDAALAFRVSNALSPDLQYYRLSLTPSLLDKVHANIKAGYEEFALFELGKTHEHGASHEDGMPMEFDNLALVVAAKQPRPGAPYYQAQLYLEQLMQSLGHELELVPLAQHISPIDAPFELGRAAIIKLKGQDQSFGIVGEYTAAVRRALKLPDYCAGFELGIGALLQEPDAPRYQPLSRFPEITQDITLKIEKNTEYATVSTHLLDALRAHLPDHVKFKLQPITVYQKADEPASKRITLRLSFTSYQKTMTDAEVDKLLDECTRDLQSLQPLERV